jgi:hypothetical protein
MRVLLMATVVFGAFYVEGIIGLSWYNVMEMEGSRKPPSIEKLRCALQNNLYQMPRMAKGDVDSSTGSKSSVLRLYGGFSPLKSVGNMANSLNLSIRGAWTNIMGQKPACVIRPSRRKNKLFAMIGAGILGAYFFAWLFDKTAIVKGISPMWLFLTAPVAYATILQVAI